MTSSVDFEARFYVNNYRTLPVVPVRGEAVHVRDQRACQVRAALDDLCKLRPAS